MNELNEPTKDHLRTYATLMNSSTEYPTASPVESPGRTMANHLIDERSVSTAGVSTVVSSVAGPGRHKSDAERLEKYRAENKKLRRDLLAIRATHEEMAMLMEQSATENQQLIEDKKRLEKKLKERNLQLANGPQDANTSSSSDDTAQLLTKIKQLESELKQVTKSKNAEIQELNKQLTESKSATKQTDNLKTQLEIAHRENKAHIYKLQQEWNEERESLRDEVRRLNIENSRLKNSDAEKSNDGSLQGDDEEDEEWTRKYDVSSDQSKDRVENISNSLHSAIGDNPNNSNSNETTNNFDSADITCLQSIITTLRSTIHQSTTEKELLEKRLAEEQSRSQAELQSFAKTLEGVDDLRKSAERMSRELRRIKVKGYKPTRSDLMYSSMRNSDGGNEEFAMADEASKEMEEAIRLIECQNDALNERWSATRNGNAMDEIKRFTSAEYIPKRSSMSSMESKSSSLVKISEDDDNDDGFMSYWGCREEDEEKKKEKKTKDKKKKKKISSNGSVFTSFF